MKKYIILFLLIAFFSGTEVFSQKYPYYIKPSDSLLVGAKSDTLWVMTQKQMLKTLKVARINKSRAEEISLMKIQIETLKEKSAKKDTLIDTLEADRDYYSEIWEDCNKDVIDQTKKNIRQKKKTRIAIITGSVTTVLAFFAGGYLLKF